MSEESFPLARVTEAKPPWHRRAWHKGASWMWVATAACAVLAVGLTWHSLESRGTDITIRFPDGHGLKPGDPVRHRGIDIGLVTKIELSESLDAVIAHATLVPSATSIAVDGSKFWIVRPQLELTGISGLETAVGSKYIAVQPGDSTLKRFHFDGLVSRPPDGVGQTGIELVLRGEERYGVHPGSPLTWRGVDVGSVLSVALSPDARHVDVHVQVDDAYRRLVSRSSKFWVTSGFDIELGVTGLEVTTDSLASLARGGIAFISPQADRSGEEVQPGDVFTLHEEMDPVWLKSAGAINLLNRDLPAVVRIRSTWKEKVFGFTRNFEAFASALVIKDDDSAVVLFPIDLASVSPKAIEGSFHLTCQSQSGEISLDANLTDASKEPTDDSNPQFANPIARLPIDVDQVKPSELVTADRIRTAVSPEDCFAVRSSRSSENETTVVIEMIGKGELRENDAVWVVDNSSLQRDAWHGAAVIASGDESIIGMLWVGDDGPIIIPFSPIHMP